MKSTPFRSHRLTLTLVACYFFMVSCAATAAGTALQLQVKGGIGPATRDYVLNGIEYAQETGSEVAILELDTPGGLDSAMRDIIKGIIASSVPVITYVSPSGSRAASAGTYILYASHVAAMAPATTLGAATPVQIGGGAPSPPIPGEKQNEKTDKITDDTDTNPLEDESLPLSGTAMERKAVNDAAAYIRGLAELRSRNAEWAERAVREAVSLTAEAALEKNVIDIIAVNVTELLEAIKGMSVIAGNKDLEISTANLKVEIYEPDWRTRLLMVITDPNIAYLLMLVGVYGLILEGYNPGAFVPGIVGAICLLIALFAFQVLPVNYAGLALIALGIALIVAETFAPSFGALGLGGIIAFVLGSVILMDTDVPGFTISRALIVTIATVGGTLLLTLVLFLIRSRRKPFTSGAAGMLGETAEVLENFGTTGTVLVQGDRWKAKTSQPLVKGQLVQVTDIDGLVLKVEP